MSGNKLNLEDPTEDDYSVPDDKEKQDIQEIIDREFKMVSSRPASEVVSLLEEVDGSGESGTYTVTVDSESLEDESGKVRSEDVRNLYGAIESAVKASGVGEIFTDSDYKTAGFTGSLSDFELAYVDSIEDSDLYNELAMNIEIERQENDYEK